MNPDQPQLPGASIVRQPLNIVKKERPAAKSKNPNAPEQLAIWKTAKEIKRNYQPLPGDIGRGENAQDMWMRKADEANNGSPGDARKLTNKETLTESIRRNGIKNPVTLQYKAEAGKAQPMVMGGHHRIAAAHYIGDNTLVPVQYAEDPSRSNTLFKRKRSGNFRVGSGDDTPATA